MKSIFVSLLFLTLASAFARAQTITATEATYTTGDLNALGTLDWAKFDAKATTNDYGKNPSGASTSTFKTGAPTVISDYTSGTDTGGLGNLGSLTYGTPPVSSITGVVTADYGVDLTQATYGEGFRATFANAGNYLLTVFAGVNSGSDTFSVSFGPGVTPYNNTLMTADGTQLNEKYTVTLSNVQANQTVTVYNQFVAYAAAGGNPAGPTPPKPNDYAFVDIQGAAVSQILDAPEPSIWALLAVGVGLSAFFCLSGRFRFKSALGLGGHGFSLR